MMKWNTTASRSLSVCNICSSRSAALALVSSVNDFFIYGLAIIKYFNKGISYRSTLYKIYGDVVLMLVATQSPNAFQPQILRQRRDVAIEYEIPERSAGTQFGLCEFILRSYFSAMESALIMFEKFP